MIQTKRRWLLLSPAFQKYWRESIVKPFRWLFLCFFQPTHFWEEFEHLRFARRFVFMLRFAIPILLISFFIGIPVQLWISLVTCSAFCSTFDMSHAFLAIFQATVLGVLFGLIVGFLEDISLGIILGMALGITGIVVGNLNLGLVKVVAVAIALGLIAGTARGVSWGMLPGVVASILSAITWALISLFTKSTVQTITGSILIAFAFLVSYTLGYYRVLIYLVSGPSVFYARYASHKNPLRVFAYLRNSALHWDEYIFLPLPGLKRTLLTAAGQDIQQTLHEIGFIISERPQQQYTALVVACEIALRDMVMRESIRDIAEASRRLTEVLPQEATLIDHRLMAPFARLADVSREAARYCGPLSWQSRSNALEAAIDELAHIYPTTALPDPQLGKLLSDTVTKWRAAVRYEQEKLEHSSETIGQIMNPYNAGNALKPHDSLFVGRRDLVRQLSEALNRGSNRPTFLLNGERRMGKSSTLRQLPILLGSSHICVFYDLQDRGISSSIDIFLSKLAEGIYKAVSLRGMFVNKIEPTRMRDALRKNEAAVYRVFDEWLDTLEKVLVQENRLVILMFDEFEKLEEADAAGYLDINLLLDWFRSTMQNRSHLALLFSGVRTFGEMSTNWAAYFVNAKTLNVSFLGTAEAQHLITSPVPGFPSNEIFDDAVVAEIIFVTGCHPFLIQAVCSELIEGLNLENRERAEIADVATAAAQVLDHWWDTFFRDLWERTDQHSRVCLRLLKDRGIADISLLTQWTGFDEQTVRKTLQTLLRRDLVIADESVYRLAVPLLQQWIERNT